MVSSTDILNAKILVVDDNATNVSLLERMLHSAGYTSVTSTNDPHAVYELYRENRYGLILLDLQMPGMDGFQVMEGLKEIEGDGYLPVLVTTAEPSHKLRALKAGAKDFVSKPFDLAELRARVHNILQVRLLHLESKRCNQMLEETVRELEASREVIRLKTIDEQKKSERELALAQETQESLLPGSCLSLKISISMPSTIQHVMSGAISMTFSNWIQGTGWAFWRMCPAKGCRRRC